MERTLLPHASDEVIEQYSMGSLTEKQAEPLEEHLLVCAQCQDRLEQTDQFVAAARAAARKLRHRPPPFKRISGPMWAAGIAAVLLVLVLATRPWASLDWKNQPPAVVMLTSARGAASSGARAPSSSALVLTADLTELPALTSYRMELVDANGRQVREATVIPKDGKVSALIPGKLARGTYWVRLYSPPGELLREYGLKVE